MPNTFWSQVTDEDRKQLLRCVLELKDKARVVVTHGTETWVRPSGRFFFPFGSLDKISFAFWGMLTLTNHDCWHGCIS